MSFATYCRLRVPVWAPDRDVIRAARKKLKRSSLRREHREARHAFLRSMLAHHRDEQALCKTFAL